MKVEIKAVTVDYTIEEIREGIQNVYGSRDMDWLFSKIHIMEFTRVVNELQRIYFSEEKDYTLERMIEDAVMLVLHVDQYKDIIDEWC